MCNCIFYFDLELISSISMSQSVRWEYGVKLFDLKNLMILYCPKKKYGFPRLQSRRMYYF